MINKDLGLVTAYAYAVSKGYTGTEDEFAELMASYASVAEQAEESAEDSEAWAIGKRDGQDVPSTDETYHNNSKYYAGQAGTSASTAASSASSAAGSASSAATSAATATEKAGEASTSATAASTSAASAAGSATNAASSATAASASATAAGNAQTAAETAQGKAEDAQEAAEQAQSDAEAAAQSVSQSAAQISQNASDISDLKSDKAPVIIDSASGAIASFPDGADGLPIHKITVDIKPMQAGSGDPSPENVRPISGWTAAEVSHSGEDTTQSVNTVYNFPTEAGTVYGGTLTINDDGTGTLLVDSVKCPMWTPQDSSQWQLQWYATPELGTNVFNRYAYFADYSQYAPGNDAVVICDCYKTVLSIAGVSQTDLSVCAGGKGGYEGRLIVHDNRFTDPVELNQWLRTNEVYAAYKLRPEFWQTYQLTAQQVLNTLYGENNIWADCGDATVEYPVDTKLYIDTQTKNTRKLIAGIEAVMTATKAYSAGDMLIVGDTLFKATTSIANGATLTPGTNVIETTVSGQLIYLVSKPAILG